MATLTIVEDPDIVWVTSNSMFSAVMEYVIDHIKPDSDLADTLTNAIHYGNLDLYLLSQEDTKLITTFVSELYDLLVSEGNDPDSPRAWFVNKTGELLSMLQVNSL